MLDIDVQMVMHCTNCPNCGILFGIPKAFEKRRRNDHAPFYCPSGHSQVYQDETEAERLRKRLHAETLAKEHALREVDQAKKDAAKVHRRLANGTCPCCKRTFKQLAAHMQRKHPDYSS